jgi:predicted outer membrane repeat protein
MKNYSSIFLLVLLLVTSFSTTTVFATSQLVVNTADSGTGSLRAAVLASSPNDSILFSPSINGDAILLTSQLDINKPLVIIGNGVQNTILDGINGTNFRLLSITAPCTISNVRFQNGGVDVSGTTNTSLWGGAVNYNYASGDTLKISHCRFEDNKAYLGGAIRVQEGTIELSFCSFSGNESFKFGGAINTRSSSVTTSFIRNCIFYQNSTADRGGAIYAESGNNLAIIYSNFVQNNSGTTGGGFDRGGGVHNIT